MVYEIIFKDGNKKLLQTYNLKLMIDYICLDTNYNQSDIVEIKRRKDREEN